MSYGEILYFSVCNCLILNELRFFSIFRMILNKDVNPMIINELRFRR